jgi:hypothetical protein
MQKLAPDGLPMVSDTQVNTRVTQDQERNILSVSMSLIDYEPASLGNFRILTAEETLKQMTSETLPGGSTESSGSSPDPNLAPPQYWYHDYPDDQSHDMGAACLPGSDQYACHPLLETPLLATRMDSN